MNFKILHLPAFIEKVEVRLVIEAKTMSFTGTVGERDGCCPLNNILTDWMCTNYINKNNLVLGQHTYLFSTFMKWYENT